MKMTCTFMMWKAKEEMPEMQKPESPLPILMFISNVCILQFAHAPKLPKSSKENYILFQVHRKFRACLF